MDYSIYIPRSLSVCAASKSFLLIFSQEEQKFEVPAEFLKENAEILISNYDKVFVEAAEILRPYETFVVKVK